MENELVHIGSHSIDGEPTPTVNARDLHGFLGADSRFAGWIRDQIENAKLLEGRDYLVFPLERKNSLGGRPRIEYHLTLDAARSISMMSGRVSP